MRGRIISAAALLFCTSSASAIVRYTLSLGDNGSGTPTANSFAIYAQDGSDNGGIFGVGVDLHNATFTSMVNQLPAAQIRLPSEPALTRTWGFDAGRAASVAAGIVSGVQDFSDPNMVPLYSFGQSAGTFPAGATVVSSDGTVPYAARALVGTGTWSGGCPAFEVSSSSNLVSVWVNTSGRNTRLDSIEYRQESLVPLPCVTMAQIISTISTRIYPNRSVGNLIYGGKLNDLIGDPATVGSAEVEGAGDEVGSSYFMAKLTGTDAQIAAALDAVPYSIAGSESKFKELQTLFGSQFGGGGFNALFEIPNIPGPEILNWDFANYPGVAIDKLAVVPEPAGAVVILALGLLAAGRRKQWQRAAGGTGK
jgi:hypothetical protein